MLGGIIMADTKTAGQKLKDELLMNVKNGW